MSRRRFLRASIGRHAGGQSTGMVEQLLARYSAERLHPSPETIRGELRASILQAFVEKGIADATSGARAKNKSPRWAFAAGLVALLVIGGTVAAAETGPGEPLYGLRLTIESLTLPPAGSARVDALLTQLEARLSEAHEESARRSESGMNAAVSAYETTLARLTTELRPGQRNADAAILEGLRHHADTLQAILGDAPVHAQPGIQQALDQTQRAQQAIEKAPESPAPSSPHPGPPGVAPGRP
jgi:hypothetical protein